MLPYSQYAIATIIVLLVVGGFFAGIIARARRSRPGLSRLFATLGGLVIVQVLAIVQTAATTRSVLQERDESVLYLVLLTAVAVLATLTAWVACILIATAPRAGAGLGLIVGLRRKDRGSPRSSFLFFPTPLRSRRCCRCCRTSPRCSSASRSSGRASRRSGGC